MGQVSGDVQICGSHTATSGVKSKVRITKIISVKQILSRLLYKRVKKLNLFLKNEGGAYSIQWFNKFPKKSLESQQDTHSKRLWMRHHVILLALLY